MNTSILVEDRTTEAQDHTEILSALLETLFPDAKGSSETLDIVATALNGLSVDQLECLDLQIHRAIARGVR